VKYSK